MAAFDSPQPSRISISECSVCLDAYHPQECIPRMLKTCGHTFCERCLVQLQEKASPAMVVKCPSCRTETKLKEKEPFPKNYALLETIEQSQALRVQQEEVLKTKKCDRCSDQPAEFGCGECVASLCARCWGKVHNFGTLRSHEKVDCSEVIQVSCPNHPSKTADLVCLEKTCASYGSLICLLCEKTALHKGHLTEPIEQVAEGKREELREIIKKAQKNVDFALSVLVKVQENDELLHDQDQADGKNGKSKSSSAGEGDSSTSTPNRDRAIRLIDETFNPLFEELTQRKNSLIQQVDALVKDKAAKLEEQRVELSTFLSRSYSRLQEASQTLKKSNDRHFMSVFRAHYDPLLEVSKIELFPEPLVTPLVDLSFPQSLSPLIRDAGVIKDDGLVPQIKQSANGFKGIFVRKFGSQGSGDGQFSNPYGITFSSDGLLYVCDSGNNRIQVFRSDGTFVRKFGSNGSGDGQFACLAGTVFSPDGLLFVCDQNNHRIQVFGSDGTFVRQFGSNGSGNGQFSHPSGITFNPDGLLYVSDQGYHRIQVLRSDGTFVRKFGSQGSGDGQFSNPYGITFSSDGLLYVSDWGNHRIQVFRSDGTFVRKFGSNGSGDGQFNHPDGIVFSPDGLLFVTDDNNRIQVFRSDGAFIRKFGSCGYGDGQFYDLEGIAFSPDGHLYVCDIDYHRIQVFQ